MFGFGKSRKYKEACEQISNRVLHESNCLIEEIMEGKHVDKDSLQKMYDYMGKRFSTIVGVCMFDYNIDLKRKDTEKIIGSAMDYILATVTRQRQV